MADPGSSVRDERTLTFYDDNAAPYAERAHGRVEHPRLAAFAAVLPPDGAVLDLGCGGGQDAAAFLKRGFAVTAIDASPAIAAEACRRTGLDVRVLSFDDLDYAEAFDGIWASASLHHAPFADQAPLFARIHRALKPGGLLSASYKVHGCDVRDRFGRLFCEMSARKLRALVAERALWQEPVIGRRKGSGYDNEPTEWLTLSVRRQS
jgi:SAM-dependent methyltransferase